jgi:probable rRNA maturation factor
MEPPSSHSISVINPAGYSISEARIINAVAASLELQGAESSEVRILLTDDEEVRRLNSKFRHLDEATDVLTFPEGEWASGDIAISVEYAQRQAAARGIQTEDEIVLLSIHGALHLAGLDDESEPERSEMMRQMNRIAQSLGMPTGEDWSSLLHEAVL